MELGARAMKRARLISVVPPERVHQIDGGVPAPGDIVELDQGFTFPDGRPGGLVACFNSDGSLKYELEVYESEIEVIQDD